MNWFKSFWKRLTQPPGGGGQVFLESGHNFTPRAQQALALAHKEADYFNHHFIGTEHLLLGLIRLGQGVAVNVLQKMGLDLETVRREVKKQVGAGPDQKAIGKIPYTPRVKKVLAIACKEAKALHHTYVGTEHILLGLLQEGEGVAARVLKNLGVETQKTRQEILKELDPNFAVPEPALKSGESLMYSSEAIDINKRYDIYCSNRSGGVLVYRNALFKRTRSLLRGGKYGVLSEFVELQQNDGETVFVARSSIISFCEHGVRPNPESATGQNL